MISGVGRLVGRGWRLVMRLDIQDAVSLGLRITKTGIDDSSNYQIDIELEKRDEKARCDANRAHGNRREQNYLSARRIIFHDIISSRINDVSPSSAYAVHKL